MIKLKFKCDILKKMFKNLSTKYYEENKKRLSKKACERYQNLSKEEKEKKQQYGCERHRNLIEDEKNKLVEQRKKCLELEKTFYYNYKKIL